MEAKRTSWIEIETRSGELGGIGVSRDFETSGAPDLGVSDDGGVGGFTSGDLSFAGDASPLAAFAAFPFGTFVTGASKASPESKTLYLSLSACKTKVQLDCRTTV